VKDEYPLVDDRRPIQDHLWSIAPVGDAEDQARILGVDSDDVEAAGRSPARPAATSSSARFRSGPAASNSSAACCRRPTSRTATRSEFRLRRDVLGHLVMTNALFAEQVREVDGAEPLRIGRGDGDT